MRVVHYVNQFFGGLGGEESAGVEPRAQDGAVGPGRLLEQVLGPEAKIVRTVICGDNYAAENLEDLTGLGVAPTSYVDDEHAFAFLPFGVSKVAQKTSRRRLMNGLILPMLLEESEWRVDLPGWRLFSAEPEAESL